MFMFAMGCVSSAAVAMSCDRCDGGEGVREETGDEMLINVETSRSSQPGLSPLEGKRRWGFADVLSLYINFRALKREIRKYGGGDGGDGTVGGMKGSR
jgi:hypothetical protein